MRILTMVFLAIGSLWVATASADEAHMVAKKMIEAHGGMEKWSQAPTVSFKHTMIAPQQPDDPWTSIDVTEQGSRRTYQDWPLDEATIVFDGKETWSTDWKRLNPPKFMVNMAYYFLNLPWITQDDGVVLGDFGEGKLPHDDKAYITIRMTFEAGVGDAPDDYYVIYIDPDTHLMRGCEYIVTYGAMLDLFNMPPDVKFLGPLVKVFDDYEKVDGLMVPMTYKTYTPNGQMYGDHSVENVSFKQPFDEARMKKPNNAVIDTSSNERKKAGS